MTATGILNVDLQTKDIKELLKQSPVDKDGFRAFCVPVRFVQSFNEPPQVLLGVLGFSAGGNTICYRLRPVRISPAGFEINIFVSIADWVHWIDITWLATDA